MSIFKLLPSKGSKHPNKEKLFFFCLDTYQQEKQVGTQEGLSG